MGTNFDIDRGSRHRRISSSENHVVPATDLAALLAYTELYTLRTVRRELQSASDSSEAFAAVVARVQERHAKGIAAITRVKNPRVRAFLSDPDALRAMPADVFTSPVGAWTAGVTMALSAVIADLAIDGVAGTTTSARVLAMIERDEAEARKRWTAHETEIIRQHPEIEEPNPAFTLVMTEPDAPYYLVPVTI